LYRCVFSGCRFMFQFVCQSELTWEEEHGLRNWFKNGSQYCLVPLEFGLVVWHGFGLPTSSMLFRTESDAGLRLYA
jgi:hypothetical protein